MAVVSWKSERRSLSDYDMYRCMYRVERFIELWEIVNGIPLIRQGIAAKEAAYQARQAAPYDGSQY